MSLPKEVLDKLDKIFGELAQAAEKGGDFQVVSSPYIQKALDLWKGSGLSSYEDYTDFLVETMRKAVLAAPETSEYLPAIFVSNKTGQMTISFARRKMVPPENRGEAIIIVGDGEEVKSGRPLQVVNKKKKI